MLRGVNCAWCNVTSCLYFRTVIMEVIWNNKDCVLCSPVQHLSVWAIVHNRIEYKINFHLAPISMSLNIYSWSIFSKCIVCSFTPLHFQNECVPCSLLQRQQQWQQTATFFMHLSTAALIRTYFVVHPKLHANLQEEIWRA